MKSRLHALFTGLIVAGLATIATTAGPADAAPATRLTPPRGDPLRRPRRLLHGGSADPGHPGGQRLLPVGHQQLPVAGRPGARRTDLRRRQTAAAPRPRTMTTGRLPGVAPQFDALTPDTDLVSVSIGGNDFSVFGTLVGFCPTLRASDPTGAPCRDAMRADGRDRLLADVQQTSQRVETVVRRVHELAPHARRGRGRLTPTIAPRQGTCPDLLPLADGDYQYAQPGQQAAHAGAAARRGGDALVVRQPVPGQPGSRHLLRPAVDQRSVHRPDPGPELPPVRGGGGGGGPAGAGRAAATRPSGRHGGAPRPGQTPYGPPHVRPRTALRRRRAHPSSRRKLDEARAELVETLDGLTEVTGQRAGWCRP